jgi:hypothetical protein
VIPALLLAVGFETASVDRREEAVPSHFYVDILRDVMSFLQRGNLVYPAPSNTIKYTVV